MSKQLKPEDFKDKKSNDKDKSHFMQINPHIVLVNKDIENLQDGIYDVRKKTLILKAGIQDSKNLVKECSNGVIKNAVRQISDLKELIEKGADELKIITENIKNEMVKIREESDNVKHIIHQCTKKVEKCENDIGYHLLGKKFQQSIKSEKTGEQDDDENNSNSKNNENNDDNFKDEENKSDMKSEAE